MMKLLDFKGTERILKKYDIPFAKSYLVHNKKELDFAIRECGYPSVLKINGPVLHKSDLGGVKTNLKNRRELNKAWKELSYLSFKSKGLIDGFLLYKMIVGREIAVGMKRDPSFGPVLMVGLGGIFIEVLKDVSFGVCPVSYSLAQKMLKKLKSYPILTGIRGQKPINIRLLIKIIHNLSSLSLREKNLKAVDLNPLIASEKEVVSVDAKLLYES